MNKTLIIIAILIAVGGVLIYSTRKPIHSVNTSTCANTSLAEVKAKTQEIESKISSYSSTTKDVMDKSAEGGEQTDYTTNGSTVLVKQMFFGENGKSEVSYFFSDNKIFYVKKVNSEYVMPLSVDPSGQIKNTNIKEFILDNNQELCSWYQDQATRENNQDTKDLLNYLVSGI